MLEVELFDQLLQFLTLVIPAEISHLKHGEDIILHGHLSEHRCLLRQVTYTELCTFVHRIRGYIRVVKEDFAAVGCHKTCSHVERSCFAGTVRTKQTYYLTLFKVDTYIVNYGTFAVLLIQVFCT